MIEEIKKLGRVYRIEDSNIWIEVDRKSLIGAIEKLKELGVERINMIVGIDEGKNIEILYQFFNNFFITLKTSISKKSCRIESISKYFRGANLFERELAEMFGIEIVGMESSKKLFLPSNIDKPMRR